VQRLIQACKGLNADLPARSAVASSLLTLLTDCRGHANTAQRTPPTRANATDRPLPHTCAARTAPLRTREPPIRVAHPINVPPKSTPGETPKT
jgi:hypothetical protein